MDDIAIRCPHCGGLHLAGTDVRECDPSYGNCLGCDSQEPVEVLEQMNGFCSSQCEREYREDHDG